MLWLFLSRAAHPSATKDILKPDRLNSTNASCIAASGVEKFVVHDCLHFLAEQHTGRMNGYVLIAHQGFVGAI